MKTTAQLRQQRAEILAAMRIAIHQGRKQYGLVLHRQAAALEAEIQMRNEHQ